MDFAWPTPQDTPAQRRFREMLGTRVQLLLREGERERGMDAVAITRAALVSADTIEQSPEVAAYLVLLHLVDETRIMQSELNHALYKIRKRAGELVAP